MKLTKAQERTLLEIARGNRTENEYQRRTVLALNDHHLVYIGHNSKLTLTSQGRALVNELDPPKQLSLIEQLADHPKWLFQPEVEYICGGARIFCTNRDGNIINIWFGGQYPMLVGKYENGIISYVDYTPTPPLPHITWELSLGINGGVRGNATIWHDVKRQQGLTLTFGYIWRNGQSRIDIVSTLPVPDSIEDAASFHQIYMKAVELEQPIGALLREYAGQ